jgi:hypothetical protein
MESCAPGSDQRRLDDEEDEPRGEHCAAKMQ